MWQRRGECRGSSVSWLCIESLILADFKAVSALRFLGSYCSHIFGGISKLFQLVTSSGRKKRMAIHYNPSEDVVTLSTTAGSPMMGSSTPLLVQPAPLPCTSAAARSKVNILILGKVGVGKARIMNEVFEREVFKNSEITEVVQGVSQREAHFVEKRVRYEITMFDTVGIKKRSPRISMSKTMTAIRELLSDIYPYGINLLLLVYRHEDRTKKERKAFMYILNRLNEERVPLITALVITGCANKNDSARKKVISEFDSDPRTQLIGRYALRGMYAVGFTNISSVPDAMMEMYRAVNYRDALMLRSVIERCSTGFQNRDNFFYSGRFYRGFCKIPWHHCPCYDRIYTCLKWGYTWEECLRVEEREDSF